MMARRMTPEERFEHIEEAIVQMVDIQREQAEVQRNQSRTILELTKEMAKNFEHIDRAMAEIVDIQRHQADAIHEVTEKLDALIDVVDKMIKRNGQ